MTRKFGFSHKEGLALVVVCLAVSMAACEDPVTRSGIREGIHTGVSGPTGPVKRITFINDIAPLFERKCAGCHYEGSDLTDVSLYSAVYATRDAIRREVITGGMPIGGLKMTDAERAMVAQWVTEGAPEGELPLPSVTPAPTATPTPAPTAEPTPAPTTSPGTSPAPSASPSPSATPAPGNGPTYKGAIAAIFKKSCNKCHEEYETYEGAVAAKNDIVARLKDMPPRKPLPDDQQDLIRRWVAAGAPEGN